jgi:hypothetical protein
MLPCLQVAPKARWGSLEEINTILITRFPKTFRCDCDSELEDVPAVTEIH